MNEIKIQNTFYIEDINVEFEITDNLLSPQPDEDYKINKNIYEHYNEFKNKENYVLLKISSFEEDVKFILNKLPLILYKEIKPIIMLNEYFVVFIAKDTTPEIKNKFEKIYETTFGEQFKIIAHPCVEMPYDYITIEKL